MNRLEKYIYDYIKFHPSLKMKVRNLYMDLMDLIPDYPSRFEGDLIVKENYFFGFHDHTPFSKDDQYILSNKLEIPLRMPKASDPLTVGYWDNSYTNYFDVGKSYAWNYHKGCRLQWVSLKDNRFIFNTANNNKLCSKIVSASNQSFEIIDYPIDSISPNGLLGSSFSYERLEHFMPGYGYHYSDNSFIEKKNPSKTGIFIVNLNENRKYLICSIEQLVRLENTKSMTEGRHYVTHSLFSPDSKEIAFLHRWVNSDDVSKRNSRLIVCNIDGTNIRVAPTNGMVSHFVWDKNNGILAYCRINDVDGHYIFKDSSLKNYKPIAVETLNSDGHQHFIPGTRLFVTDTYPNQRRYAKLFIVDIDTQQVRQIADIKSYKKFQTRTIYRHWGCDLHPRVNFKGDTICFDSVHTGKRSLCLLKIKHS